MGMCYEKKDNDWVKKCMEYEVKRHQTKRIHRSMLPTADNQCTKKLSDEVLVWL